MRTDHRLELPDDPDRSIWTYISIMKVTPVVINDLLLVQTIPLRDSTQMDLYTKICILKKVHKLTALHPELGVELSYILKGHCLAISKHVLYVAIPKEHDIRICMVNAGYLCMLNQTLYPLEILEWYICALYISGRE